MIYKFSKSTLYFFSDYSVIVMCYIMCGIRKRVCKKEAGKRWYVIQRSRGSISGRVKVFMALFFQSKFRPLTAVARFTTIDSVYQMKAGA